MLLLATLAHAGTATLVLPPGEDPRAWASAATLAGLDIGAAGDGPSAVLRPGDSTWTLVVHVGASEKVAPLEPPTTPALREDAAWLAASMVRELSRGPETPSPPPRPSVSTKASPQHDRKPTPPAPPATLEPSPAPPPSSPPAEVAAAPAPTPDVAAPVPPSPPLQAVVVVPAPPAPEGPHPWVSAAPAVSWRYGTSLAAALDVDGGLYRGELWAGLGLTVATPRGLADAGGAARLSAWGGRVAVGWCPDRPVAPLVGGGVAVELRRYLDESAVVNRFITPVAMIEGGAAIALPRRLALIPALQVRDDLVSTFVHRGDAPYLLLSPWQVDLVLGIRLRP